MIEKICPIHNVPVFGEKCPMRECDARPIVSTTVYWCAKCRIPSFEKTCAVCGDGCDYMTTDVRPVFPEEKLLLGILLDEDDPHSLENASVWNSSSGYYVDGRRVELAVQEINAMPLNQVAKIKSRYDREYQNIDRTYFDGMIERFIECNKERYLQITDEAISYIQSFEDRYSKEEMYISFSGGKDSTVTSDLVTKAFEIGRAHV